jgi:hypothetical protein
MPMPVTTTRRCGKAGGAPKASLSCEEGAELAQRMLLLVLLEMLEPWPAAAAAAVLESWQRPGCTAWLHAVATAACNVFKRKTIACMKLWCGDP